MESTAQAFSALHAPVATYTWEIAVDLPSAAVGTNRIPIQWSRPVEIVGLYGVVIVTGEEELAVPTLDDILVCWDINSRDRLTNRLERAAAAIVPESMVTLTALLVNGGQRLTRIRLEHGAPDSGMRFQWERGAGVYQSARVKVAFYCNYI